MLTTVLIYVASVLVGLCAGTWIDHAAAAIPAHRSAASLPSCPHCEAPWRGLALIPLIGPLLAKRCANCDTPIGWLRPATEATTAILFALAFWRSGLTPQFAATAIFCVVLLVILRIDWRHHLIFQHTILVGLMIALAYAAIASRQPKALFYSGVAAVGAALLFLFLYGLALAIYKRRALGFGDVLLAALIGAMAGTDTIMALMIGMLLGAGGGLLLVALRVRTMRDYIPYGAYLCAGTIITLLVR